MAASGGPRRADALRAVAEDQRADARLRDGTPLADLLAPDASFLLGRVMTDPEIYDLELDRVFARNWIAVAHETEVPHAGDYVLRHIGEDQVIVSRAEDGQIHILLNSCSHRRMALCRADFGNATHFRCPYHGFVYKNSGELVGVPAVTKAYGTVLDKSRLGLVPARTETYDGLVFGCFDPDAPPLLEYLGDMAWYLDLLLARTPGGMEVVGPPQRFRVQANWKLAAENFVGDAYHAFVAHEFAMKTAQLPPDATFGSYGVHVTPEPGHGIGLIGPPADIPLPPYLNLPAEMIPMIEATLTPPQAEALRQTNFIHGGVYPNLSFLNVMLTSEEGQGPVPFLTLRVWVPRGAEELEVVSWFLVERCAPDWFKDISRSVYIRTFGSSGTFEQDDTEIWGSITQALHGAVGRRQQMNLQLGTHKAPDAGTWLGPGAVFQGGYSEANQRAFYRRWLDDLLRPTSP